MTPARLVPLLLALLGALGVEFADAQNQPGRGFPSGQGSGRGGGGREDLCPPCDGLAGSPQIMPKASGPWGYACVPPVPEWEVIGEKGNYCCYFARYEQPIQGEIVTPDQAGLQHMREVSLAGGSCGSNPCDPKHRTFICQGPGTGGMLQDEFHSHGDSGPNGQPDISCPGTYTECFRH